jgi:hypothetical protein
MMGDLTVLFIQWLKNKISSYTMRYMLKKMEPYGKIIISTTEDQVQIKTMGLESKVCSL